MRQPVKIAGSGFRNGKFYLYKTEPSSITVIRGWPARCWRTAESMDGWRNFNPGRTFDKLWNRHFLGKTGTTEKSRREYLNYSQLLETIPDDAREIANLFSESRWDVLQFLNTGGPRAYELFAVNPPLAYALSLAREFRYADARMIKSVLKKRQRDILLFLGYPGTNAAVRIFRKIPPYAICSVDYLFMLRTGMRCQLVMKRLGHMGRISAGVMALAEMTQHFHLFSQRFLHEVSELVTDEIRSRQLRQMLDDTTGMMDQHGGSTVIRSMRHLAQVHDRYAEIVEMKECEGWDFPPQPLADMANDWIEVSALKNSAALYQESREQSNCAYGYARRITEANGHLYLYRIDAPSRATLSVVLTEGRYVLHEIRGYRNSVVPPVTLNAALRWLAESQEDEFMFKLAAAKILYQIEPGWSIEDLDFDENNVHRAADFDIPF